MKLAIGVGLVATIKEIAMNTTQYRNLERVLANLTNLSVSDSVDGIAQIRAYRHGGLPTVESKPFDNAAVGLNTILDMSHGHWVYTLFQNKNNLVQLRGGASDGIRHLSLRFSNRFQNHYVNCDVSECCKRVQDMASSKWFAELESMIEEFNNTGFKYTHTR